MLHLIASLIVIAAGNHFTCTPTRVWDGDGPIWCAEGMKIRLAGVAAREIDGSCRAWQPCPAASGVAARRRCVSSVGCANDSSRHDLYSVSLGRTTGGESIDEPRARSDIEDSRVQGLRRAD